MKNEAEQTLIHELGHALVALRFGLAVSGIELGVIRYLPETGHARFATVGHAETVVLHIRELTANGWVLKQHLKQQVLCIGIAGAVTELLHEKREPSSLAVLDRLEENLVDKAFVDLVHCGPDNQSVDVCVRLVVNILAPRMSLIVRYAALLTKRMLAGRLAYVVLYEEQLLDIFADREPSCIEPRT